MWLNKITYLLMLCKFFKSLKTSMQIVKEWQKILMHFTPFIFLFSCIRNEAVHLSSYVSEWIEAGARWIG